MLTTTTMRLAPVALACLLLAGSVSAEGFWNGSGNLECIASCHAGSKECYAGARDGFQTCSLGFGCEEIRDALRATCYGPDRDHEACKEAWGGLRTCLEPCVACRACTRTPPCAARKWTPASPISAVPRTR
jgi:hypothetical protein